MNGPMHPATHAPWAVPLPCYCFFDFSDDLVFLGIGNSFLLNIKSFY